MCKCAGQLPVDVFAASHILRFISCLASNKCVGQRVNMECKKHPDWLNIQPMSIRRAELGYISQFGQNMTKAMML